MMRLLCIALIAGAAVLGFPMKTAHATTLRVGDAKAQAGCLALDPGKTSMRQAAALFKSSSTSGAKTMAAQLVKASGKSAKQRSSAVSSVLGWCASQVSPATTTSPPTTVPTLRYPNGEPVLPGFPRLVPLANIDSRVRSWLTTNPPPSDQAVELAPGVFANYNPAVPNLASYLRGPVDGDCAVRREYFPTSGGACWNGVPEA